MAYCGVKKGHTTVEFLVAHFSPRKQAIIDSFNELVCTIFFFLITWKSVEQGAVLKEAESITTVLELPLYPFLWVLAIGSALLCLVFLIQFIGSIAKVK
jgi:TRAP-type C4-dicarboxylate transport system permease small subunit